LRTPSHWWLGACAVLFTQTVAAGLLDRLFSGDPGIVATMGSAEVVEEQVREHLLSLDPQQQHVLRDSGKALDGFARAEALRRYVIARSEQEDMARRPDMVARIERASDEALYRAYIRTLTTPPARYPDEQVLRQAYESNKRDFIESGQVRVRQIFFARPANAGEADRVQARAEVLSREAIDSSGDSGFAALAEIHSEHVQSVAKGGDLGWVAIDRLLPEVRVAMQGMRDGEVRGPVRSTAGWHILRLEGIRPGRYQPFDAVKESLRERLRVQRQAELEREHLKRLVKTKRVSFDNQAALRRALRGGGSKYDDVIVAKMGSAEVKVSDLITFAEAIDATRLRRFLDNDRSFRELQGRLAARRFVLREAWLKNYPQRVEVAASMARARVESHYSGYILNRVTPGDGFPDDTALRTYYRDNSQRYQQQPSYRLAQIYLADASAADESGPAGQRALQLATQARARGSDFAALASEHSEHKPSAGKGGEIGWTARDKLVREIAAAIGGARVGDVIGPVRSAQGWHVVRLLDERPATVRPFAEVRETIRKLLRLQYIQREEKRLLEGFVAEHPIEVDEERLAKLRASL